MKDYPIYSPVGIFRRKFCLFLLLSSIILLPHAAGNVDANHTVNIIAPSFKSEKLDPESIKKYVEHSLGLKASMSAAIYGHDLLYANTDAFRANDLVNALTNNNKIIWPIRGGAGAARLIPYLEQLPEEKKAIIKNNINKKIVIGYSDMTVLHLYLQNKYHWQTIHGTMLEKIIKKEVAQSSVDQLMGLISGKKSFIELDNLKILNNKVNPKQSCWVSKVVGGNLTLVENSLGTAWQVDAKGKILFLEDVDEKPYAIERSLDHLKQAHIINNAQAVILSSFSDSGNHDLIEKIKQRFAESVSIPVFTLQDIGHTYINNPLPLNTRAVIDIQDPQQGLFSLRVDNVWQ